MRLTVRVRVTTRASRSEVTGVREGVFLARLAAPPVDGKANAELVRLLASTFRLRQRDVAIIRGQASRNKTVELSGDSTTGERLAELNARLSAEPL